MKTKIRPLCIANHILFQLLEFASMDAGEGSSTNVGPGPVKDQASAEAASKAGWGEPLRYDYDRYKYVPQSTAANVPIVTNDKSNDASNGSPSLAPNESKEAPNEAGNDSANETKVADEPAWAANATKYEWSEEYGDVGPANLALEAQLFRDEHINRTGIAFDK